jgi:hypothetical protein
MFTIYAPDTRKIVRVMPDVPQADRDRVAQFCYNSIEKMESSGKHVTDLMFTDTDDDVTLDDMETPDRMYWGKHADTPTFTDRSFMDDLR